MWRLDLPNTKFSYGTWSLTVFLRVVRLSWLASEAPAYVATIEYEKLPSIVYNSANRPRRYDNKWEMYGAPFNNQVLITYRKNLLQWSHTGQQTIDEFTSHTNQLTVLHMIPLNCQPFGEYDVCVMWKRLYYKFVWWHSSILLRQGWLNDCIFLSTLINALINKEIKLRRNLVLYATKMVCFFLVDSTH